MLPKIIRRASILNDDKNCIVKWMTKSWKEHDCGKNDHPNCSGKFHGWKAQGFLEAVGQRPDNGNLHALSVVSAVVAQLSFCRASCKVPNICHVTLKCFKIFKNDPHNQRIQLSPFPPFRWSYPHAVDTVVDYDRALPEFGNVPPTPSLRQRCLTLRN